MFNNAKKRQLSEVVFATDAFVLEKKSEAKMQTDLAIHEARLKREQVHFKFDGPTMVEEEAPGYPVAKSLNKKLGRVIVKKPQPIKKSSDRKSSRYGISVNDVTEITTEQSRLAGGAS